MRIHFVVSALALASLLAACSSPAPQWDATDHVASYTDLATRTYEESVEKAERFATAIDAFLASPDDTTLALARDSWIEARLPYGRSEVFRFYGGPIDGIDPATGEEGPEIQLNSWPLNEAFLDYVVGNPEAGIVNDLDFVLDRDTLVQNNAVHDEADVTTGWHAIEFLLWGQDLDPVGAGNRPASDYEPGDPIRDRRRQVLTLLTEQLVEDLRWVRDRWQASYGDELTALPQDEALSKIFSGVATLAGFEMAGERLGAALDSGEQEDEHSCFSDTTHLDFRANLEGLIQVFSGRYESVDGTVTTEGHGLRELIASVDPDQAAVLENLLAESWQTLERLDPPFDAVLRSPPGSTHRITTEELIVHLQQFAEGMVTAGESLGIEVVIAAE
ncbi:MAG: imelysin family protein [Acidobacteriota bacterium]